MNRPTISAAHLYTQAGEAALVLILPRGTINFLKLVFDKPGQLGGHIPVSSRSLACSPGGSDPANFAPVTASHLGAAKVNKLAFWR